VTAVEAPAPTPTRWTAAEWRLLRAGDRVRVTHEAGDVGIGDVVEHEAHGATVLALSMHASAFQFLTLDLWEGAGWTVEMAERPLPTEPGLYAKRDAAESLFHDEMYSLSEKTGRWATDQGGRWAHIEADLVPRDLVRLVPETEAAMLRARIAAVESFVASRESLGVYHEARGTIIALLGGA